MSENIKMEELEEKGLPSEPEKEKAEVEKASAEQDLLKTELERVTKASKYTEKEKAEHTLKSTARRLKEMGEDPASILGIEKTEKTEVIDDPDAPPAWYLKEKAKEASKTALQMADEIPNETERELVQYHLNNSIKSTGNPNEDLKLARSIVNASKNSKIIEEVQRKTPAKTHSSGSGSPAKPVLEEEELNADELAFMKPPFNMTKADILKTRK